VVGRLKKEALRSAETSGDSELRTHLLLRHVYSSTRIYTDFSGLVQVAAESEYGASLHRQRKCCPLVTVTLESRLK
jgi:hypothetical protein